MLDIAKSSIQEQLQKRLKVDKIEVQYLMCDLKITVTIDAKNYSHTYYDIVEQIRCGLPASQITYHFCKQLEKSILSEYFNIL